MIKIFGTNTCAECKAKIAEYEKSDIKFKYYDLETAEGLAEAAYHGILKNKLQLPVIIQEE